MNTTQQIQQLFGDSSFRNYFSLPDECSLTPPSNQDLMLGKYQRVMGLAEKLTNHFYPDFSHVLGTPTPQELEDKEQFKSETLDILNEGMQVTTKEQYDPFSEDPNQLFYSSKFELSEGIFRDAKPHQQLSQSNYNNTYSTSYIDLDNDEMDCVTHVLETAEFAPVPQMENAPFTEEEIDCFKTRALEVCKGNMVDSFRSLLSNTLGAEDIELNIPNFENDLERLTPALTELLDFQQETTSVDGFKVYGSGQLAFNPNAPEILPNLIEKLNIQQSMEVTQTASRKAML